MEAVRATHTSQKKKSSYYFLCVSHLYVTGDVAGGIEVRRPDRFGGGGGGVTLWGGGGGAVRYRQREKR